MVVKRKIEETSEPLKDTCFVFTGEMEMPREVAQQKVVMLGGRYTSLPSRRTTYLVAGNEPGPSKMAKAKELGILVLTEKQFLDFIESKSKNFEDREVVDLEYKNDDKEPIRVDSKDEDKHDKEYKDIHDKEFKDIHYREFKDLDDIRISSEEPWSEKYRPKSKEELIGNQNIFSQLVNFLKGKTDYKSVLLSGSPGVGKTTAAYLAAKECNLTCIEFNASDVRNKGELNKKIKNNLNNFNLGSNNGLERKVLIMDEIDGMTSDRGGLAELGVIIKKSRIPIICICNDRSNMKIRGVANYSLDLRFRKLDFRQVLGRVREILKRENKNVRDSVIQEVFMQGKGDMRYILNILQVLCLRHVISSEEINLVCKKTFMRNIFDLCADIFMKKKIWEKIDVYFEDYSFVPLMVHENYLKSNLHISEVVISSDSISYGDVVDRIIHGPNQEWGLSGVHAFFSSVLPSNKPLNKKIDFSNYLGQNSKKMKNERNLLTCFLHGYKSYSPTKVSYRMYDSMVFCKKYLRNIYLEKYEDCVKIIEEMGILKEDIENIIEICYLGGLKDVPAKGKSTVTRLYKKLKRVLPYFVEDTKKVKGEIDSNEEEEKVIYEE
ncbi:subunit 1 of replication factor C [Hamiltosporidium tvaerminnensis]|uniref:Replication factor C subunit 1 n=1 Tax=Hamiltosporidium tvaerminnensis TaxID=1176355 RepID=A0A4Q9M0T3_9MICR|nr:subunit 1 of replication factor C [Hamiltosporidium tvaerminnensis]